MSDIVIVGNGVAGDSAANVISRADSKPDTIILTSESHPFYQRTRLGEVLSGQSSPDDLLIHESDWYESRGMSLLLEEKVTELEPRKSQVVTHSGKIFSYNQLLLATGAKPLLPPIDGLDMGNVFTLRTLEDVKKIKSRLKEVDKAAVIGGGLLGLESAYALNQSDIDVKVVETLPAVMSKQLDAAGSHHVQSRLEQEGIDFRLGAEAAKLSGSNTVNSVTLTTGEDLRADLVIISAGISPNVELANRAGIRTSRGILVDENLKTSHEDIYAAGDVIEQNGQCYGIWPPAQEQGKVAGRNMLGNEEVYDGSLSYYRLKVASIDLISAGVRDENSAEEVLVQNQESENTYKKFFLSDRGELIGAILVGNRSIHSKVLNGLRNTSNFEELNDKYGLTD